MKSMELIGKKDGKGGFCSHFVFFSDHLSNLPDLWGWSSKEFTDGKAKVGRVREEKRRDREEERRSEKKKSQKKDAGARKGRKVAIHCVFSNDLWLRRFEKYAR